MTRKLNILTCLYTLFLILLFLSGSISGIFGEIIYLLSFALPVCIGVSLTRDEGVKSVKYLTLDYEGARRTLPLVAPTVSVVMIVSYLTSLLIFVISGKTNSVDVGDSLLLAIITHALLPAVLEEVLFRYLPLRLLGEHSRRAAILISAFFFALVHHNLFTIPYAFIAGIIFMTIDIALDSVIPSIIIHFINNSLSVVFIFADGNSDFKASLLVIWGLLTLLSFIDIIGGKYYPKRVKYAFAEGEKTEITIPMLIFAVVTLTMALAALM